MKKPGKKTWDHTDEGDDKPHSHGGMCAANGCQMIGSCSPHSAGNGWVCYSHMAVTSANWQEVTKRLNQNSLHVDLVTALRRIVSGQAVEIRQIIDDIEKRGMTDLQPLDDESFAEYHKRVNKSLIDLATRGLQEIVVTESGVPARTGDEVLGMIRAFLKRRNQPPEMGAPA